MYLYMASIYIYIQSQCLSMIHLFSFKLECEIIKNISFFGFIVTAVYCCSSVYKKGFILFFKEKINYGPKQISLLSDLTLALQPGTEALGSLIKLYAPVSQRLFFFLWTMDYSVEYENQQNGIYHKNSTTTLNAFFFGIQNIPEY